MPCADPPSRALAVRLEAEPARQQLERCAKRRELLRRDSYKQTRSTSATMVEFTRAACARCHSFFRRFPARSSLWFPRARGVPPHRRRPRTRARRSGSPAGAAPARTLDRSDGGATLGGQRRRRGDQFVTGGPGQRNATRKRHPDLSRATWSPPSQQGDQQFETVPTRQGDALHQQQPSDGQGARRSALVAASADSGKMLT